MNLLARVFLAWLALTLCCAPAFAEEAADDLPTTNGVVRVGDKAPPITLVDFTQKPMALTGPAEKKPTIIVFWSFFCFPCQSEMPELQAFYDEMGPEKLSILSISLDGPQYNHLILPFLTEHKITLPIAFDEETETFFKHAEKYGVVGTPTFFILDDHGIVRFIHLGKLEKDLLRSIMEGIRAKDFCAEILKPDAKKAK